jgi:putative transposase
MPRKSLIRTNQFPYHVVARTNNKDWFNLSMDKVWDIFCFHLFHTSQKFHMEIFNFVLMSNHYHIILQTPDANLDKIMHNLNHKFSLDIGKETGRINRILGSRYKWSLIKNQHYFHNAYRYVFQNPLRAGICDDVLDYPYSSLKPTYPIKTHTIGYKQDQLIPWLNQRFNQEQEMLIKKGLQKAVLEKIINRKFRKPFTFDAL